MESTCGSDNSAQWWAGTTSSFLGIRSPRPMVLLVQPLPEWAQRRAEALVGAPAVPSSQAVCMLSVVQPPEKAVVLSSAANGLGRGGFQASCWLVADASGVCRRLR